MPTHLLCHSSNPQIIVRARARLRLGLRRLQLVRQPRGQSCVIVGSGWTARTMPMPSCSFITAKARGCRLVTDRVTAGVACGRGCGRAVSAERGGTRERGGDGEGTAGGRGDPRGAADEAPNAGDVDYCGNFCGIGSGDTVAVCRGCRTTPLRRCRRGRSHSWLPLLLLHRLFSGRVAFPRVKVEA